MEHHTSFTVNASIEAVKQFHRSASSLTAITPPLIPMTSVNAPDPLEEGSRMGFTLWLGPIPVRWEARIEAVNTDSFIDRQISGPFASWSHLHEFSAIDETHTRIDDRITYRLKSNPFWWLVGASMALGLPLLFRFRAYKTRQILEGMASDDGR